MHETWWSIATDPDHIIAELLWSLVFDVFFVAFLWGVVWKRLLLPKLRRDIHREIDAEHGVDHTAAVAKPHAISAETDGSPCCCKHR